MCAPFLSLKKMKKTGDVMMTCKLMPLEERNAISGHPQILSSFIS
jgi:hypothetical protein